jgi:cation diffusion facilitator family transporter
VARATESIALEANAHNITADIFSTSGVLVGMVVIRFTGLSIIDPILAIVVALLILRSAYSVVRNSFGGLVDARLPEAEERVIREGITEHVGQLVGYHALRTRRSGNQRYVDLHLVMPKGVRLEEANEMCNHLEQDIKKKLRNTSVVIHVEPCDERCDHCPVPESLNCRP